MRYEEFPGPWMDISACAIEAVARELGPAFIYTLRVSPQMLLSVRSLLRSINADAKDNVLAPYVNLQEEESYGYDEWSLAANNRVIGSPGSFGPRKQA